MLECTVAELVFKAGADLGASDWVLVDQARIDSFAEATEDRQWIHVDAARAASGPFGATIAHGYLTLSLIAPLLGGLLLVTDASSAINYGLDRVRFPAPVLVNSRLRAHGSILKVEAHDGFVQTTLGLSVESDRSEKPVCIAQSLARFLKS